MVEQVIIDNESGRQYRVALKLSADYSEECNWRWQLGIYQRDKGKRKWISLNDEISDNHEYRRVDFTKRDDYMEQQLRPVLEQISRIAGYDIVEHLKQTFFGNIINLPVRHNHR